MTSIPLSPKHPEGDEELKELPEGQFDIDLNPDLSDDSEDSGNNKDNAKTFTLPTITSPEVIEPSQGGDKVSNIATITPEFDEAYQDIKEEFLQHPIITASQQSKFINYIDDELLKIQRKFVKTQSGEINYTINELISELLQILKLIWRSISRNNINNIEYLIKILADFEDYIEYYPEFKSNSGIFQIIQFIDIRISILHDVKILSATQFVRILSIISRLRIMLISKIFRNDDITIEVEISKIFEGILDRS